MESPPFQNASCLSCGLYQYHTPGPSSDQSIVRYTSDQRMETQAGQYSKRVLFVVNYPTLTDAQREDFFQDNNTEWVMDYLLNSKFEWRVTSVNLCHPGRTSENKKRKPSTAQIEHCSQYFVETLKEFDPHVVVALGGEALKFLWPKIRGEAPTITRARSTPVQVSGKWLVTTYDPEQHGRWIESGGRDGQDLTEEYIRCFTQIHDILGGSFRQSPVEYTTIRTDKELVLVADQFDAWNIKQLCFDTEENTYLSFGNKPVSMHKEDPEGTQPERITMHHPAAKLIMLGLTAIREEWDVANQVTYHTYVLLPESWLSSVGMLALYRIFSNKHLEAWNALHDCQSIEKFLGISILNHRRVPLQSGFNSVISDGMLIRALPDQSKTGNGLKPTAQELLSAPDWALESDQQKQLIRKQRLKAGEPGLVDMGMMPYEITIPYNANDTYQNARLVQEKLSTIHNSPEFPLIVYNMLIAGYPWILEMQHNGTPAQQHLFEQYMDELETKETKLLSQLKSIPEIQRAEAQSGKEFNVRSPIFYEALIKEILGEPDGEGRSVVPEWFPRTEKSKALSAAKEVTQQLAGEETGKKIAWEQKTRAQRLFTKIIEWRNAGDDLTRVMGLYDYIVDDRIHTSFRIIRTETAEGDEGDEARGGARSGRSSTTPNLQNVWPRVKFLFQTKPGTVYLKGDYGRIELAWLAWNTQDPLMMEWSRAQLDQHRERGRYLWCNFTGRPPADFDTIPKPEQKTWRSLGKTQNFATVYLEEPRTTAAKNGIPLEEVMAGLEAADKIHPKIRELKMQVFEDCQAGRLIKTTFGRCRSAYLKETGPWEYTKMTAEEWVSLDQTIASRRGHNNMRIYRSVWNTKAGQGDASDTAFSVGACIHKLLYSREWLNPEKIKSIGWEHDALVYEVNEDYVDVAAPAIHDAMADLSVLPIRFGLPLPVDIKVGRIPLEVEPEDYEANPNALRPWKG